MDIKKLDESLFQDMSSHYMELYHFPPLTANIFTYLMFDFEQKGITFEQILEASCASKSSVSNALNVLQQSNYVEVISKLGERKRYYRVNKSIFKIQFQDSISKLKRNYSILERFAEKRREALDLEDEQLEKINLHLDLQKKTIGLFEETLVKINQIKNK
ncbi:hypothetical protein NMK71_03275 [Weeksellaceae bacterium KMM 9713]|uniref:DNA-binding transcriptional regulator GbsR, MarR family n=1 Tax=Profundicola chukchiensis TaxID=2961959 RepID=A0A9X4MWS6_9FLAO|nr:hypothetical protein [Profundicola chukchiensis]MDG4945424.1 hypothetical protein [Profundicola chukchiensis]MDG4950504.1 hypothetical protein [Profundicola chukchiensis]